LRAHLPIGQKLQCSFKHFNTFRVYHSTPCVDTKRVESNEMKSTGERIRQARESRGWSAQVLATKVGYKTQSGISNLENRATGTGGNKIGAIAAMLNVPTDWLINGPDSDDVPFNEVIHDRLSIKPMVVDYISQRDDSLQRELLELFSQLDDQGKRDWLNDLRGFVRGRRPHPHGSASAVAGK
jgi:transcriptional regulator with XRE-family HTH domain